MAFCIDVYRTYRYTYIQRITHRPLYSLTQNLDTQIINHTVALDLESIINIQYLIDFIKFVCTCLPWTKIYFFWIRMNRSYNLSEWFDYVIKTINQKHYWKLDLIQERMQCCVKSLQFVRSYWNNHQIRFIHKMVCVELWITVIFYHVVSYFTLNLIK